MQKTAILMAEITRAVPHFSRWIVRCVSEMMAIRLTMICISSWISKTQKKRMKNNEGTLENEESCQCALVPNGVHLYRAITSERKRDNSLCGNNSTEQTVPQNQDGDVGHDFTPDHIDVGTPSGVLASRRLFNSLPDGQETETEGKAHCHGGNGLVLAIVVVVGHQGCCF